MDRVKLRSEVYNILINLLQFIWFFGGGLGLKGQFSQKNENVVIIYSPSCWSKSFFFLLLNTKEDILKNVGNQTVEPLTSTVLP